MSQIQTPMTQICHELTCFACEEAVGARYDRCTGCQSTFHLGCLVEEEGCTRPGCPALGRGYLMEGVDLDPKAPDPESEPAACRVTSSSPPQPALSCSRPSCRKQVGARHARCNTCRAIYHLRCAKSGRGCTTSGCAAEGQALARIEGGFARPQVEVTREPDWELDRLKNWGSESLTLLLIGGMWASALLLQSWTKPWAWSSERDHEALFGFWVFCLFFLGQFFWHLRQEPGRDRPPPAP